MYYFNIFLSCQNACAINKMWSMEKESCVIWFWFIALSLKIIKSVASDELTAFEAAKCLLDH